MGSPVTLSRLHIHSQENGIDNVSSQREDKWTLWTLPDIELGSILDFLAWPDKLNLLSACPQVNRVLLSPLGWRTFQGGAIKNKEKQRDEIACIEKYGQFFQHCTLWLGRPCRSSWECACAFDHTNGGDVFPLLTMLVDKCKVLKSLRLYHPSHVTPKSNDTDIFKQYQKAIEKLLVHSLHRSQFQLELCGLQYSSDHIRPISLRFLDYYMSNPQVSQLVTVLDVSRSADNRLHPATPLSCLQTMKSLVLLKVPIHCVNMPVLQSMVQNSLSDLYLLSDDCTVDMSYIEQQHLGWQQLAVAKGRQFFVHYIFRQRTLSSNDLVSNPFVKSVCIDSPCKVLDESLLMTIAEHYGSSLQLLALCHSAWQPETALLDLSKFAAKCPQLTLFISTLMHFSTVLLSLMQNAPSLRDVLMAGHSEEMIDFMHIVSQTLYEEWQTSSCTPAFHIHGWELSFLLDEHILRYGVPMIIHKIVP